MIEECYALEAWLELTRRTWIEICFTPTFAAGEITHDIMYSREWVTASGRFGKVALLISGRAMLPPGAFIYRIFRVRANTRDTVGCNLEALPRADCSHPDA